MASSSIWRSTASTRCAANGSLGRGLDAALRRTRMGFHRSIAAMAEAGNDVGSRPCAERAVAAARVPDGAATRGRAVRRRPLPASRRTSTTWSTATATTTWSATPARQAYANAHSRSLTAFTRVRPRIGAAARCGASHFPDCGQPLRSSLSPAAAGGAGPYSSSMCSSSVNSTPRPCGLLLCGRGCTSGRDRRRRSAGAANRWRTAVEPHQP